MTKCRRRDNQTCTSSHRERTLSGLQTWREGSTFLSGEAKNARHITVSGMEPLETQPDPELKPAYFDPDTPDISEQQFAASLEAEIEKPAFVVDQGRDSVAGAPVESSCSESRSNSSGDSRPRLSGRVELDNSTVEQAQPNLPVDSITPDWRDQVSAKVNKYKSSKAPKVRYPSLQLQFDPPATRRR